VICSGDSGRQVQAIADAIHKQLIEIGYQPLSVEGLENGQWVLMDYAEVIVHLFQSDRRDFYGLDQLWGDVPRVRVSGAQLQRLAVTEHARAPRRRVRPSAGGRS
jgi:ribosome-associated protein